MLAALLVASLPLVAQPKVGYVDVDRVLRESKVAQQAQKKMEIEFSVRDRDLAKLVEQFNQMKADLEKDYITLGDAARQKRERALNDTNVEVQRKQREFSEDLNQRRNDELAAVLAQVDSAVTKIAQAENFDIVFREAVWVNPAINITDKVIKAMDEVQAPPAR